jgi:hypothetical protein
MKTKKGRSAINNRIVFNIRTAIKVQQWLDNVKEGAALIRMDERNRLKRIKRVIKSGGNSYI